MCSDTSEIAWMQHEIGYCHLTQHEPIEALQCGISAFENAEAADDVEWQINSCVLIAQAYRKHFISRFPFVVSTLKYRSLLPEMQKDLRQALETYNQAYFLSEQSGE